MMKAFTHAIGDQKGISLIFIAICLFMLLAMAALALDIGHLVVTRNELQNAADAGALAGARVLYNDAGTSVNPGANQVARDAAVANASDNTAVEVLWSAGNSGDVQRGHWRFSDRTFHPVDTLDPPVLWGVTWEELDADLTFVNAVRVVARRQGTPVSSFFARIFGYPGFLQSATAVAYIGFAGSLGPGEVDQPIAICKQSILFDGEYNCNVGRMINSGSNSATSNTGGWTNFTQPCETASTPTLRPLICGSGNPEMIVFGQGIGATGGQVQDAFVDLLNCWLKRAGLDTNGDKIPDKPWVLTLPVVDCPGNNVSNCAPLKGAVTLKLLWIQDKQDYQEAPRKMEDWPSAADLAQLVSDLQSYFVPTSSGDRFPDYPAGTRLGDVFDVGDKPKEKEDSGRVRWASFVKRFNLKNVGPAATAPYASFAQKSIYFLPDCTPHEPAGTSQGENFGILARIPVLVN